MKFLIIGGAGYIGAHVCLAFLEKGHNVSVLDNFSSGSYKNLPPELKIYEGDILDTPFLENVIAEGWDGIVHLAALKAAGESMIKPEKYARINISGTIDILNTLIASGNPPPGILLLSSHLWKRPIPAHKRRTSYPSPKLLRPYQTRNRKTLQMVFPPQKPPFSLPALLQRRRLRHTGPHHRTRKRPPKPPAHTHGKRHRTSTILYNKRQRLQHSGWNLHTRLHPRQRPGRCPRPGHGTSPEISPRLPVPEPRQRTRSERLRNTPSSHQNKRNKIPLYSRPQTQGRPRKPGSHIIPGTKNPGLESHPEQPHRTRRKHMASL